MYTKLDFPHFPIPADPIMTRNISSAAINIRASSMDRMVRPKGPVDDQRSFHSDQYSNFEPALERDWPQSRDGCTGACVTERIVAVAAFREQRALGAAEVLGSRSLSDLPENRRFQEFNVPRPATKAIY